MKVSNCFDLLTKEKDMPQFLIVDDYTDKPIWDDFIFRAMLSLKSKPVAWTRKENTLPEGPWTLFNGMYPLASDKAYKEFGVRKPAFNELPVIFVLNCDGTVQEQCNVTADQAAEFIAARI